MRPTGTTSWTCSEETRSHTAESDGTLRYYFRSGASSIVLTAEQLQDEGLDVDVRQGGEAVVQARGLHHGDHLIAGDLLFKGGIRYGLRDSIFHDVVFHIAQAE